MGMTRQACMLGVLAASLATACGGPLRTGTTGADASAGAPLCPSDFSLCGAGPAALCIDLRSDPEHCGSCQKACLPGVACAAGVCQRVVCQDQPVLSGTPITSSPILDSTFGGAALADVNGDGTLDLVFLTHPMAEEVLSVPDGRRSGPGSFSVSLGQA